MLQVKPRTHLDVLTFNNRDILIKKVRRRTRWSQTIVRGSEIVEIPTNRIRQTEAIGWPLSKITRRPVLLVKIGAFYYPADGNHRLVKNIIARREFTRAYILSKDTEIKRTKNIAGWIDSFLCGEDTWTGFKDCLYQSYLCVQDQIKELK